MDRIRALRILMAVLMVLLPAGVLAGLVPHHGGSADPDGKMASCLSCHDGSSAGAVSYCTVQCDYRSSHPVMRDYPPKGSAQAFASRADLKARGIRFEHGKVTCISCHDIRNPAPKHLISGPGKNLCRLCHLTK